MSFRSSIKAALHLLTNKEKSAILFLLFFQIASGIFDLVGLASLSIASILLLRGTSQSPSLSKYLPGWLSDLTIELSQVLLLIAVLSLVAKTILSFYLNRKLFSVAKNIQYRITTDIFDQYLQLPVRTQQASGSLNDPKNIIDGVANVSLGLLTYISISLAEISLLLLIIIPLLIIQPAMTLFSIFIFACSIYFLNSYMGILAIQSGIQKNISRGNSENIFRAVTQNAAQIKITNTADSFKLSFSKNIADLSASQSNLYFVQQVPKYVLEMTILLLGISSYFVFRTGESFGRDFAQVILLVGASFRLLPSLLRLQGAILIVKGSLGESQQFFKLLEKYKLTERKNFDLSSSISVISIGASEQMNVLVEGIGFSYSPTETLLQDITFAIEEANSLYVVNGGSGRGKSTLMQILLGLLTPSSGKITFKIPSTQTLRLGYMPQDAQLVEGTVIENIAFGVLEGEIDYSRALMVANDCKLNTFLGDGVNTDLNLNLGLSKRKLSGGETQRLILARVLYFSPNFLVLDEPTSSLDKESKEVIVDVLGAFREHATILVVTHGSEFDSIAKKTITI
jgi:ABC-type bacteriocin/lantibiotic exporter with double-glycine peptidase domain